MTEMQFNTDLNEHIFMIVLIVSFIEILNNYCFDFDVIIVSTLRSLDKTHIHRHISILCVLLYMTNADYIQTI